MATSVCKQQVADMPHIADGPYRTFAFVMTILFPILLALQLIVFIWARKYSVFLRKRSLTFIILAYVGTILIWSCTILYDYLGSDKYPCWLFLLLSYLAPPMMAMSILLQVSIYISEISMNRVRRTLQTQHGGLPASQLRLVEDDTLNASQMRVGCMKMWLAHMTLVFRIRVPNKDRLLRLKLLNISFVRSNFFVPWWLSVFSFPFIIAFSTRLAIDPELQSCSGCDLNTFDASFLLVIFILGTLIGERSHSARVSRVDALRISVEAKNAWRMGYLGILCFSLYLADPGNLYANHIFNFRVFLLASSSSLCYLKTTHQVIMARYLKRHLVTASGLGKEDRYKDVMTNKELKQALYNHLDSEMSSEIYHFMEDVDEFRTQWDREKDTRQLRARQIFDTYIQKRSPYEVNLSANIRDNLTKLFVVGNVELTCFDDAYTEVKNHFLDDGFARFLSRLNDGSIDIKPIMGRRSTSASPKRKRSKTDAAAEKTAVVSVVSSTASTGPASGEIV